MPPRSSPGRAVQQPVQVAGLASGEPHARSRRERSQRSDRRAVDAIAGAPLARQRPSAEREQLVERVDSWDDRARFDPRHRRLRHAGSSCQGSLGKPCQPPRVTEHLRHIHPQMIARTLSEILEPTTGTRSFCDPRITIASMSEITDVLAAIESLSAKGERMALATIVAVRGSTYRRPGARLLVPEDGAPIGNLSGGCLEADVADVARVVMEEGRPRLAGWDLTADDDAVWGLGLGCNGAIEVFIEPADRAAEAARALRTALNEQRPISLVTVLESGREGVEAGARVVVRPDGSVDGSLGDDEVHDAAVTAARERR